MDADSAYTLALLQVLAEVKGSVGLQDTQNPELSVPLTAGEGSCEPQPSLSGDPLSSEYEQLRQLLHEHAATEERSFNAPTSVNQQKNLEHWLLREIAQAAAADPALLASSLVAEEQSAFATTDQFQQPPRSQQPQPQTQTPWHTSSTPASTATARPLTPLWVESDSYETILDAAKHTIAAAQASSTHHALPPAGSTLIATYTSTNATASAGIGAAPAPSTPAPFRYLPGTPSTASPVLNPFHHHHSPHFHPHPQQQQQQRPVSHAPSAGYSSRSPLPSPASSLTHSIPSSVTLTPAQARLAAAHTHLRRAPIPPPIPLSASMSLTLPSPLPQPSPSAMTFGSNTIPPNFSFYSTTSTMTSNDTTLPYFSATPTPTAEEDQNNLSATNSTTTPRKFSPAFLTMIGSALPAGTTPHRQAQTPKPPPTPASVLSQSLLIGSKPPARSTTTTTTTTTSMSGFPTSASSSSLPGQMGPPSGGVATLGGGEANNFASTNPGAPLQQQQLSQAVLNWNAPGSGIKHKIQLPESPVPAFASPGNAEFTNASALADPGPNNPSPTDILLNLLASEPSYASTLLALLKANSGETASLHSLSNMSGMSGNLTSDIPGFGAGGHTTPNLGGVGGVAGTRLPMGSPSIGMKNEQQFGSTLARPFGGTNLAPNTKSLPSTPGAVARSAVLFPTPEPRGPRGSTPPPTATQYRPIPLITAVPPASTTPKQPPMAAPAQIGSPGLLASSHQPSVADARMADLEQMMMATTFNPVPGMAESVAGSVADASEPPRSLIPPDQMLTTQACPHTESWKRLRAKRGHGYYLCQRCGAKWKTSGRLT